MPLNYRASFSTGYYGNYYYCNINHHILKQKVLRMLHNTPLSETFSLRLNVMNFMNHNTDSNDIILDAIIHKAITEKPGGAFMEHYIALFSFIHQQLQFVPKINTEKFQQTLLFLLQQKLDSLSRSRKGQNFNSYLSTMLLIAQLFAKLLINQRIVCNIIESILSSTDMKPFKLIGLCVLLSHCGRLLPSDDVAKYAKSIKQLSQTFQGKNITKMIENMDNKLPGKSVRATPKDSPKSCLNEQDQMMKNALIKSLQIVHLDAKKSTMFPPEFPFIKSSIHKDTFIASQSTLKLLFVIDVDALVRLKSIIIHAPCMEAELYGYLDIFVCAIDNDVNLSDFTVTRASKNVISRSLRCPAISLVNGRNFTIPQTSVATANKYAVHIAAVDGFFCDPICINGITFSGDKTLSLKQLYLLFGKIQRAQEAKHVTQEEEEEEDEVKKEINEEAEKCRSRLKVIAESQVYFLLSTIHALFLEYFNGKLEVQFTSTFRPKDLILYFSEYFELRMRNKAVTVFSNLCQTNRYNKKQRIQSLNRSRKEMEIIATRIKSFDLYDFKNIFLETFGYNIEYFFRTHKAKIDFISYYKEYFKIQKKKQSVTVISRIYKGEPPVVALPKKAASDTKTDDDEPLSFERLLEIPVAAHWISVLDLPSHFCDTNVLSSMQWFGYWEILDIRFEEEEDRVIIEFEKVLDAREAVGAMHGRYVEVDKRIRVEIGHNYYCGDFLNNPDHPQCKRTCTRLHKWINRDLFDKLSTVRLWKKRALCVRGFSDSLELLCDEDTTPIRSWFGSFGEIESLIIHDVQSAQTVGKKKRTTSPQSRHVLVFLTFYDEQDARNAVQMMDGYFDKQYRTKLRVRFCYSVYCPKFLRNGMSRCRCSKVHRWIHAKEMGKPNTPPKSHAQVKQKPATKIEIENHIERVHDPYYDHDAYSYDGVTGCIQDIRQIQLQSDDTICVRLADVNLYSESVLRSNAWFGQFGAIKRVIKSTPNVFVAFEDDNSAKKATASALNGKCVDGQVIRLGVPGTNFCLSFLLNPYIHSLGGGCGHGMHKWISKTLADRIKDTIILQRSAISVEGLSDDLCDEDVLRSSTYFGQYGQIKRISVLKSLHRAHITYYEVNNAMEAVRQSEASHRLKVSIMRNKYCPNFLNKYECNDSNCLYVHYWAQRDDIMCDEQEDEAEEVKTAQKEGVEYYNDDGDEFGKWLRTTVHLEEYLALFEEHQYDELSMIEFFDEDVLKEIGIVDESHWKCILEHVEKFKASMDALQKWFETNSKFKSCQHLLMKNNIMTLDQLQEKIKSKQDAKRILTTLNNENIALFVDMMQTNGLK
eukprot:1103386_1